MGTTYTIDDDGQVTRNLSATLAAEMILGADGDLYELRHDAAYDVGGDRCWQLYVSDRSVNASGGAGEMRACHTGWGSSSKPIRAYAPTDEAAWPTIAGMVLTAEWVKPSIYTDADYDALLAEIAADELAAG